MRRRLATLTAVAAIGWGVVASGGTAVADPPTTPAPWRDELGVNTQQIYTSSWSADEYGFLARNDITTVREHFDWGRIEDADDDFDWSDLDNMMEAADLHGMDVLAIMAYSPIWLRPSTPVQPADCIGPWHEAGQPATIDPGSALDTHCRAQHGPATSAERAEYVEFVDAVLDRYGPGGTFWAGDGTPHPIRAVEIWNEPYSSAFWLPAPNPARYADLLEAVAPTVHAHGVDVVSEGKLHRQFPCDPGGDDPGTPWGSCPPLSTIEWTDDVLAELADPDQTVDVWSVHPYPESNDDDPYFEAGENYDFSLEGKVEGVIDELHEDGVDDRIWITEIGWEVGRTPGNGVPITIEQQASWTDAALTTLDAIPQVERIYTYTWSREFGISDPSGAQSWSLRYRDGAANDLPDRPRLAFWEMRQRLFGRYPDPGFSDVSTTNPWYAAVTWAAHSTHGVTNGYPNGTFQTNTPVSRGAFVTMLWRALGEPDPGPANPFTDVGSNYDDAVSWAYNHGIVVGSGPTTFNPSGNALRWHLAVWIHRAVDEPAAASSPAYPFTDAMNSTYRPSIHWLYQQGIVSGYDADSFQPTTTAHRGHAVTWLRNLMASPAHWTHADALDHVDALPGTRMWSGTLDWVP